MKCLEVDMRVNIFVVALVFTLILVVAQEDTSSTRGDALQALNESHDILDEMKAVNFSGAFVGDILIEAERIFQQVEYAQILRGNVESSTREVIEAEAALKLVDWRSINYSDVLEHTEEIKEIRELAFFVQDLLSIQENFLGAQRDASGDIVSFTKAEGVNFERFKFLINEVQLAIEEARYEEARELAETLKEEVDIRRTEVFTALALAQGFGSVIIEYWYYTLSVLIFLSFGGYYFSKGIRRQLLKKKVRNMKNEKGVLLELMKKAQTERFKENSISGLVYDIRMKKFEDRMNSIKEDLPVLEKRLLGRKDVSSLIARKGVPSKQGTRVPFSSDKKVKEVKN